MDFKRIVRRGVLLLLAAIVTVAVAPVVSEFFVELARERGLYERPSSQLEGAVSWLSHFVSDPLFRASVVFIAGLTIGVWLDFFLRGREKPPNEKQPEYVPTRIRLSREPGSQVNYKEDDKSNIYSWQQTYSRREFDLGNGKKSAHQIDTFFFIFDMPIKYSRPVINAFGHEIPPYNWYATTDRGAVLLFQNQISVPTFEITFPPINEQDASKSGQQEIKTRAGRYHLPGQIIDVSIFPNELSPSSINRCSPLQTMRDQHTGEDLPFLGFNPAAEEACQGQHRFLVANADSYMRFRVKWSAEEIGNVVFELSVFRVNRPPIPIVTVVDMNGYPNLPAWTEWGGPVKLPADCQETFLIERKIADEGDTLAVDARLHQIHMTAS